MNQITLTEKGKDILAAVNNDGNVQYWVGYFGLAYVPVQNTTDTSSGNDAGLRGLTTLIGPNEKGDYIYNIWQGDLTGGGYAGSDADFTRLTQYDANLSANFRYAYDEEAGCNRLVAWTTKGDPDGAAQGLTVESYARKGYRVYTGCARETSGPVSDTSDTVYTDSQIPVPAPLLYLGSDFGYTTGDLSDMANSLGEDWPMSETGGITYPRVTPDMRCYGGKKVDDAKGDDVIRSSFALEAADNGLMEDYRCFVSLSKFNKGHAQVSSEGYETDYQESCHNMSRVTKLFPISRYEVKDSDPETKGTRTGNANSIKYRLSLDFGGANRTYRDVLNFEDDDAESSSIFEENPNNSFKFNRVGIYAVPVSIRKFRKEGSAACNHCQLEVDPDENPVLVAIISLDEVMLSEDGSMGFTRWAQDFILNLEHVDPEATTPLVRDVEVYYNLVENEAITWYQNQLLASAGLSEAVTSLGVDVAYLKNRMSMPFSECAAAKGNDDGDKYASIYHTHDYLKNLVDAEGTGSVKGINSTVASGRYSLALGVNNSSTGDFSISMGPWAESNANYSISVSGGRGLMGENSHASMLLSTSGCTITDVQTSLILTTSGCTLTNVQTSLILTTSNSQMSGGRNDIILGSLNYGIIPQEPTVITVAEYLDSLNNTGSYSTLSPGWYCFSEDDPDITDTIVAYDTTSGEQKTYNLEDPVDGLYYAINVNTDRQPLYKPTITVFSTVDNDYKEISVKYLFRVPSHTNVMSMGYQNALGNGSSNNIIIGHSNDARYTNVHNTFILGDGVLGIKSDDRYIGLEETGEPIQREINNVSVMGELSGNVFGGLKSGNNMATENYHNAHIFLNKDYVSPQMFGIFPDPLGAHDTDENPDFPIDTNNFDVDGVYHTVAGSPDSWADGLSRQVIHDMINSATVGNINGAKSVPMIYTGGICLAGEYTAPYFSGAGEQNAGRIKLGSGVLPSAYITSSPVDGWFRESKYIIPTSIIGTTDCPYKGLVLGLTGQQEIDGTMHIGLFRYPETLPAHTTDNAGMVLTVDSTNALKWDNVSSVGGGVTGEFTHELIDVAPYSTFNVTGGKRYVDSSSYITIGLDDIDDGEEFILVVTAQDGSPTVQYPAIDDSWEMPSSEGQCPYRWISRGSWLCRAASYIADDNQVYRGLVVSPIGTWQIPPYGIGKANNVLKVSGNGTLGWASAE